MSASVFAPLTTAPSPVRPSPVVPSATAHIDSKPKSTTTVCAHCGLPVPSALLDLSVARQFCCSGCATAFAILNEHGLGRYYALRQRRETAVRSSDRTYEEFDHAAFAQRYITRLPNGLARTELYLEGVHCASCVWLVERTPLVVEGVVRAELDVRRSLAVVEWDDTVVQLSSVARILDQLGYAPHPFRGVARDTMRKREDRAMLVRIGVAGAIAANLMLAAFALYSGELNGMDASMTRFFRWISLALIVPAFVWPGRVFFKGAYAALRTRTMHMDLPIAVALAAGLLRGAINTALDSGPVYFDGLAILIFALLVGRFLQQRGQRMATDSSDLLHAIAPVSARIMQNGALHTVPVDALLPGMLLDVRAGETFAADGTVAVGTSAINAALLTGESRPQRVVVGQRVFAGMLNVEAPLQVHVDEAGEESRIARLLRRVEETARRRAPVVQMAHRMAGVFVGVVLVAAALTFAIKWFATPARALDDAIALLIVTCPCALALATPLAITVAMGRAAKRGMLVKGGDALELLALPGTLVLDKTGTITEGHTSLVAWTGPEWVQPLVLALEQGSSHPLADGFRRAWPNIVPPAVTNSRHTAGGGIEGVVNGHAVCVGSPRFISQRQRSPRISAVYASPFCSPPDYGRATTPDVIAASSATNRELTPVHVLVDGELVAVAALGDRVRDDALVSLSALRAAGWHTVMLSGDATDVVQSVGKSLGFAAEDAIGAASPEDKLAFVERLKKGGGRVVMVGDGVNDAAAIAAAHVGIGVHGGAEACLSTADIYLTRPGLSALVELTVGARRTMRVIRRNIAFSLGYNIIGASLAVAGLLSPLIAAVLMPLSSLTVVLGSWHGFTFQRNAK